VREEVAQLVVSQGERDDKTPRVKHVIGIVLVGCWLIDCSKMEMHGMRYIFHDLLIEMLTKCIWSWLRYHRNQDAHMHCCLFEDKIKSTSHEKFCYHT
jgi:hypothetical protein